MRSFRSFVRRPLGRLVTAAIAACALHLFVEPWNYLSALELERQKEAQIRDIARKMNVDPEFLLKAGERQRFDFRSLFAWVTTSLGLRSDDAAAAANAAQPESVRESIAKVKERYALVAADTTLAKVAQLIELSAAPAAVRGKKKGQIRAELRSLLRLIDKDFLPPVKEGLPGAAQSRDREMREAIKELRRDIQRVLAAPGALDEANVDATLAKLREAAGDELQLRNKGPRWTRDPFPVKDTYRFAPVQAASPSYGEEGSPATAPETAIVATPTTSTTRLASNAVASDVAALAASLKTPAKIFTWVHDRVEWESYSGVAKGALGTLKEGKGNDWDQALLLRDLLVSQGYDAQLEWGRVTLPVAKAMNLVGTEDPLQAANLLATAGFDGLLLTSKGAPVAVQMTHVWVRAFIPYVPNRGATTGTADTWVRMDPSFKRYEYQPGIPINGQVPWSQDEYLDRATTLQQPSQFYGDKIWSYIRAKNIDCVNLSQVAKLGRIRAANFPFVPSTLTTRIDAVRGVAAAPPADQVQSVTVSLVSDTGATVGTFTTAIADLWGKKLSLTFPPATPDDAAVIASYGGLFDTPSYLVRLKPVFSLDDQPVAEGFPISAGAALEMNLTFKQPNVADDFTHHDVVAGETHTLVFDAGAFPDSLVQSRIERLKALTAANAPEEAIRSEQLYLVGLRYMQHVDDGLAFATGVRWQRAVKRVFEANVRRQLDITYNIAGAPVRLKPAENNIDVSRLLVGIVPINNDTSHKAEALALAGLQSSYLEGAIWEEMHQVQGISAAKALLLAKAQGQQLHTVTSANVDAVLAQTTLAADVEAEIRGSVAQGRIARIATANISLGNWTGTGYILQDPRTGAATYPISGGLAGGSETDDAVAGIRELLGSEPWLEGTPEGEFLRQVLGFLADGSNRVPSTKQSDPVNVSSGNMHRTVTDVSVMGRGLPVALARTYNSRSNASGAFGFGWTWTYGEMVVPNADGSVTYREADGSEHVFAASGAEFVSPPGKHLDLARQADGWTLTFKDGLQHEFDARGAMVGQVDPNGNRIAIRLDANGLPVSVVDAAGRTVLTFTTTAGKITQVIDIAGRVATYAYDGDDLVTVTDTAGKSWSMSYDLEHNMTAFADPLGNMQTYAYDTEDRLYYHQDAVGAEEFFHYDISGRQSVITDRRGGDRLVKFDAHGRATQEVDPAGNLVLATFDADHNRTGVVDSRGAATTYEHDANGNVTREVAPDGGVTTRTFDALSRPLVTTEPSGLVTVSTYDSSGNLLTRSQTVNGTTSVTTHTYGANGEMLTSVDPNGGTTSMTWSANGTLATRTDAAGNTTTMTSDVLGRVIAVKDAKGNESKLDYDGKDRIVTLTDAHGAGTTFGYDAAGRRTSFTNARGTTTYQYDAEGRVTAEVDPLGNRSTIQYNAAGDVIARTDARGNTVRYEYDLVGRTTTMVDAAGGVWTYGYCGAVGGSSCSTCGGGGGGGTYCQLTDPNGRTIAQDFDRMGRVTTVTDSLGHVARTQYDAAGRKTAETDAAGNVTRYTYDQAGRVTSVTEATGAVTRFTYDASGNKLTQQDANGNTWSYKYDLLNRMVEEADPLGRKVTYTYDALGNVSSKKDAKGQVTTYAYSARRLTSVTLADGTVESFGYDAQGRQTSMSSPSASISQSYDALNRVVATRNLKYGNTTIGYEYDKNGNRAALVTPKGRVTYTYDAKNRLTTIVDPLLGTYRFSYDAMGRRTELKYPNGVTTSYSYDGAYRLTALVSKNSAGVVVDAWTYEYDSVGNPVAKIDLDGKRESYRYDEAYRLTEATYGDGSSEKFTYDPAGNRKSRTTPTGAVVLYSYDVANQLQRAGTEAFTYDDNGSLTVKETTLGKTTFTYDAANRLTHVAAPTASETSSYAPNGRRSQITSPAVEGTVQPEYDLAGNPILDMDQNGTRVWIYRVYGPGMDEVLGEWRLGNGRLIYPLRDALGSITAMTATDGRVMARYSHDAYGNETRTDREAGASPPSRLGFTSRERSLGTLMQYRSRYYDTSLGRFLQQDTFKGDALVPPSLHRYTYVHNNPVRYTDPTGHWIVALLAAALVIVFLGWVIQTMIDMMPSYDVPTSSEGAKTFWKVIYGIGVAIWFAALVVLIGFATIIVTVIVTALAILIGIIGLAYAYLIAFVVLSCMVFFKVYELSHMKIIPDDHAIELLRICVSPVFPSPSP